MPITAGKMKNKIRIEDLLLLQGHADTLQLARAKVLAGQVYVGDERVSSPALLVQSNICLRVRQSKRYVSRGGKKLELACKKLNITIQDKHVLDIGASTGGFTDYCLQHGSPQVTAVDVGTSQLAWSLRRDPRVLLHEKTDIRFLAKEHFQRINFVLADVSFISLTTVLPAVIAQTRKVEFLVLVKPQFELPRNLVPRGGVVQNELHRQRALQRVKLFFAANGYCRLRSVSSEVAGAKGNREIFLSANPSAS